MTLYKLLLGGIVGGIGGLFGGSFIGLLWVRKCSKVIKDTKEERVLFDFVVSLLGDFGLSLSMLGGVIGGLFVGATTGLGHTIVKNITQPPDHD